MDRDSRLPRRTYIPDLPASPAHEKTGSSGSQGGRGLQLLPAAIEIVDEESQSRINPLFLFPLSSSLQRREVYWFSKNASTRISAESQRTRHNAGQTSIRGNHEVLP